MPPEALRLASTGKILKLSRVTLSPISDNGEVQTEIQAFVKDRATLETFTDLHENDDAAMHFVLQFFAGMRASGTATSQQIAKWQRGLFVVVP